MIHEPPGFLILFVSQGQGTSQIQLKYIFSPQQRRLCRSVTFFISIRYYLPTIMIERLRTLYGNKQYSTKRLRADLRSIGVPMDTDASDDSSSNYD